jgi:hypothetical protein
LEPLTPILLIFATAFPVFVNATLFGELVVPTTCDPNGTFASDALMNGPLTPVPINGMT